MEETTLFCEQCECNTVHTLEMDGNYHCTEEGCGGVITPEEAQDEALWDSEDHINEENEIDSEQNQSVPFREQFDY